MGVKPCKYLIPYEEDEQKAFFRWVDFIAASGNIPEINTIFAIPNGGHRHKAVAGKLKATGVRKGVLDIFWPLARSGYHGLFIEMKRRSGGRLSAEQRRFKESVELAGYRVEVAEGCAEAQDTLLRYYKS